MTINILSGAMLKVIMPSVNILSGAMLKVIMLSVIIPSVIMPCVFGCIVD